MAVTAPGPVSEAGRGARPRLSNESREHCDDAGCERDDLRFVLGGCGTHEDGDLNRGPDFGGFTAGYRVGTSLVGTCDTRGAFRDV